MVNIQVRPTRRALVLGLKADFNSFILKRSHFILKGRRSVSNSPLCDLEERIHNDYSLQRNLKSLYGFDFTY